MYCTYAAVRGLYVRCFRRQKIKVHEAKWSSCEHHANNATTFRNHEEDQYVDKHVGQGVCGCACGFQLNSWDIWHPWTPCPLSQHKHTRVHGHTRPDLNNEVSCLSHTQGPPFMPHPFMSSSKSISCAVSLPCYTHTHYDTHRNPHSVKMEVRSRCWEMRLLLKIITVEDWLLPDLLSINFSDWSGWLMSGLPAALFISSGKGDYYD